VPFARTQIKTLLLKKSKEHVGPSVRKLRKSKKLWSLVVVKKTFISQVFGILTYYSMRITGQKTKAKSLACQQNFPSRWKFHAPLQNL